MRLAMGVPHERAIEGGETMTHSHCCPDCGELRFCEEHPCHRAYDSFCRSCLDEVSLDLAEMREERGEE